MNIENNIIIFLNQKIRQTTNGDRNRATFIKHCLETENFHLAILEIVNQAKNDASYLDLLKLIYKSRAEDRIKNDTEVAEELLQIYPQKDLEWLKRDYLLITDK